MYTRTPTYKHDVFLEHVCKLNIHKLNLCSDVRSSTSQNPICLHGLLWGKLYIFTVRCHSLHLLKRSQALGSGSLYEIDLHLINPRNICKYELFVWWQFISRGSPVQG
jgi:hypothetical protein